MTFPLDARLLIELNGARQRIHLLAARSGLPGLLVLHGGPGMPNRHQFAQRLRGLAEFFTVILWDQRGTGGSYQPAAAPPLTLDQLVDDARALTVAVRDRYGLESVSVLGFSWGTELGIRLVQRHPALYVGYVGSGQAVDGVRNEEIGYRHALEAAEAAGDTAGVAALRRVGPPVNGQYRPVVRGLATVRQVAGRHDPLRGRRNFLAGVLGGWLLDDEYSWQDRLGILRGAPRSLAELWPAITAYDFTRDAARLEVPVTFLQGRHDWTTPSELVEEYAAVLEAPNVRLVWFENSGHSVPASEPLRFQQELLTALGAAHEGIPQP